MKWQEFLNLTRNQPVIDAELIHTGKLNIMPAQVQLSRWVKAEKLIQLRRGIYLLGNAYRKHEINEYYVASILVKPSYISCEKALEYYGLIPEAVPVYTSVTAKRPIHIPSSIGTFDYRHIKTTLFWGYESVAVGRQKTFIALPEKALLDFFYLKKSGISFEYLTEMRLQNTAAIDIKRLASFAKRFNKPGMLRIAATIKQYIRENNEEGKTV